MEEKKVPTKKKKAIETKMCGIIMPIASNPDYPKEHWKEVLLILVEAVNETEFEPRLVSDDVAIGLIHERIVNNIYTDEIVICDVSSKNPNVMFELGLRLAFDKPTIIIKDEKTGYSFDTGVMEHINYPSSLRFNKIVDFKAELIKKINATYEKSISEPNFSPFLKSFGKKIVPAKIHQSEIAESKYILSKLENLTNEVMHLRLESSNGNLINDRNRNNRYNTEKRKSLTIKSVNKFLTSNSHLKNDDVNANFIEILRDEISIEYGIRPSTVDIINAISIYFAENSKIK
jgi:hypothetical protein